MCSLKSVESVLQQLETFSSPKEWLEQYPTSPHIASRMCFLIQSRYGDLNDKVVLDLGCGPCMLSIAAVLCGAKMVKAFDIDLDALQIARQNIENTETNDCIDLFRLNLYQLLPSVKIPSDWQSPHSADTYASSSKSAAFKPAKKHRQHSNLHKHSFQRQHKHHKNKQPKTNELNRMEHDQFVFMLSKFKAMYNDKKYTVFDYNRFWNVRTYKMCDVTLMNPPFGTKQGNEHLDLLFLLVALKMSRHCVYSLHKSSTTKYLMQFLNKFKLPHNDGDDDDDQSSASHRQHNDILVDNVEVICQLRFDVPKMYRFHKDKSKDIQVDLLRITLL